MIGTPLMPALLASAGRRYSIQRFMKGRAGAFYTPDNPNTLSTSRTGASFGGLSASSAVGMMLDVSRGGLEGLGAELVVNGDFALGATAWGTASGGILTTTALTGVIENGTAAAGAAFQTISTIAGTIYRVRCPVLASTGGATCRLSVANGAAPSFNGFQNDAKAPGNTAEFVFLAQSSSTTVGIYVNSSVLGRSITVDNVTVQELPGCHQVAPSDAARPVLEAFAGTGPLAARFNGTDRSMGSLTTLDLTSTDEVTVIAAVRKLSDAALAVLMETGASSSNPGCFGIFGPISANNYSARATGTVTATATSSGAFPSPDSALLVMRAKISTDTLTLSRNRTQIATASSDQGAGNYGNNSLFLGARSNASLRFDGQIGRLAIIGGALTAEELSIATGLVAAPYGL